MGYSVSYRKIASIRAVSSRVLQVKTVKAGRLQGEDVWRLPAPHSLWVLMNLRESDRNRSSTHHHCVWECDFSPRMKNGARLLQLHYKDVIWLPLLSLPVKNVLLIVSSRCDYALRAWPLLLKQKLSVLENPSKEPRCFTVRREMMVQWVSHGLDSHWWVCVFSCMCVYVWLSS